MKMAIFWVVTHVVWYKFTDVSEALARTSETSVNFTSPHAATTQKIAVFFPSVFARSDILFQILQSERLDVVLCATNIKQFRSHLQNEHDTGFAFLWKLSNDVTTTTPRPPKKKKKTKRAKSYVVNSVEEKYRILLYEIIDNLIFHMSARFSRRREGGKAEKFLK
jgi:hypothetical protein